MLLSAARGSINVAIVIVLLIVVGLSLMINLGPMLGQRPVVIRGGSMEPAVPRGSLVLLGGGADSVDAGAVVTVRADNGVLVTHRVVRVVNGAERQLELKGDANEAVDPVLVPARSVVGRVTSVFPLGGYIAALAGQPSGLVSLGSLLATLFLTRQLLRELEGAGAVRSTKANGHARPATALGTAALLLACSVSGSTSGSAASFIDVESAQNTIGTAASW